GPRSEPEKRQDDTLAGRPHDRPEAERSRQSPRRARGARDQAVEPRPGGAVRIVDELTRPLLVLQRATLRELLDDATGDGLVRGLPLLLQLRRREHILGRPRSDLL